MTMLGRLTASVPGCLQEEAWQEMLAQDEAEIAEEFRGLPYEERLKVGAGARARARRQ